MLDDGTYDAIVVDVEDAEDAERGPITVELSILAGEHKGEVVSLRADGWRGDPLDLLGIPATMTVADGMPTVRFEP